MANLLCSPLPLNVRFILSPLWCLLACSYGRSGRDAWCHSFWWFLIVLEGLVFDICCCLEAWSLDSVSLSCSGLPVGEDSSVVSLHAAVSNWSCNMVEDRHLVNQWVSDQVEVEYLPLLFLTKVEFNLGAGILNLYAASVAFVIDLSLVEGSDPYHYFDVV